MRFRLAILISALPMLSSAASDWHWVEGEKPAASDAVRHPWWYDKVKTDLLSGGDFISHWSDERACELTYRIDGVADGRYHFWIRANPIQSKLSFSINGAPFKPVDFTLGQADTVNIAADDKPDLRFLCWCSPGQVGMRSGQNEIRFRMESENHRHGMLDCFALTKAPFQPSGKLKPGEIRDHQAKLAAAQQGWVPWNPPADPFNPSPIDLRALNEKTAGESGRVRVADGRFVLGSGKPVRFWAVNGPPENLRGEDLRRCARMLAKHGVNLVRVHGAVFDRQTGRFKPESAERIRAVVAAMKAEGIYTHVSIYFPLWFTPEPGHPALDGYDGKSHPFAALYFNPEFRALYRSWWRDLLTTPGPDGKKLTDDTALMGAELVNEDSYFFWTFDAKNLPEKQLAMLEKRFATWAAGRHGGVDAAIKAWNGMKLPRDTADRLAFRPLYQVFTDRTPRDKDTAAFLFAEQRAFYQDETAHLRSLGFKGLVTASNWITANDVILGPLERASYTPGDFIDRHGYYGGLLEGQDSAWSIREGHVFTHRSALAFDPPEPGKPRDFSHPAFDLKINGMPSMISETTFPRPNRFRTEAPLIYAAYGALQGSDAIVHFALDSAEWHVKPGFFMQPWTLMSPVMMGQFPAAAMIYRSGWIDEGALMARVPLSLTDATALKGSPFGRNANLDALRAADVPRNGGTSAVASIDPRIHLVGRTRLDLTDKPGAAEITDLSRFIDSKAQTVTSSNRQLVWDYGKRLLRIDSPRAQGLVGDLRAAGDARLTDVSIRTGLDLAAVVLVSLDGKPLAQSGRMLLQVMTEEQPAGFGADPLDGGRFRITRLGQDPWFIREAGGTVGLTRPDANRLKVTPLDANGYPLEPAGNAARITLRPDTAYYLIAP
ncbi:MAG: hypothetical protein J0M04_15240 [Verrucomicrobia bacterium]|nr:hypothetical protein [Verrucomicrobiota bacterium]